MITLAIALYLLAGITIAALTYSQSKYLSPPFVFVAVMCLLWPIWAMFVNYAVFNGFGDAYRASKQGKEQP